MMKVIRFSSKMMAKIYNRSAGSKKRLEHTVRKIIEDVRVNGDDALVRYSRKFDGVKLAPRHFVVTESETNAAYQNIDAKFVSTLKVVMNNINKFYRKQIKKSWKMKDENGVVLGEIFNPIERVGVYVPAGTAPLVSTVYMSVLPAKIAGVKKVVLVTPPDKNGFINPYILVVANLLKVDVIYKVGGAQAISALAFGTKTIPKVDKIIGPGNAYVTEAKRQVFGYVDIDMLAGPSEVVIIANQYANPAYVTADIRAQAEHAMGIAVLITTSKSLVRLLKKEDINGYIINVKSLDEAANIANAIAPEHLQIIVKQPNKILKKIHNAGAVFIGHYSPVAVGDYVAGPSHILPTAGTAKFFSGLGISDFMKSTHVISYTKKALEEVKDYIEKIATIEGLHQHLESVKVRF
ncbi:MAG: histidinol dehydrogenase [Candidatus Omnitrophota bacterium]